MSNVRISQLNSLLIPTSDDFIPIVDSGSLTTYRTPITSLLTITAQSGSVPSASWASSSISASWARTASFAIDYHHVKSVVKNVPSESLYTHDMARIYNQSNLVPGFQNLLVSMKVWGDICRTSKNYLITADAYSPGQGTDPVALVALDGPVYGGYYEVKPLSATRNYAPTNYNTDYSLEMSQSYGVNSLNSLYFRIRCNHLISPFTASSTQAAVASLTFWILDNTGPAQENWGDFIVEALSDNKQLSNRNLPSWPTAFVEIKNKIMTVSGSLVVEKPITGSLHGTASWALNIPGVNFVADGGSYNISCSWASASLSSSLTISSSYSVTSSYAVTASYAHMAKSASFAKTAETASYITASALTSAIPGIIKAWAQCASTASIPGNSIIGVAGLNANNMALVSSYNISSVVRTMGEKPRDQSGNGEDYSGDGDGRHWIVTMNTPMPSTNYTVMGAGGGEPQSDWNVMTIFPFASKSTTQFTLSMAAKDNFQGGPSINWFNFMVLGM